MSFSDMRKQRVLGKCIINLTLRIIIIGGSGLIGSSLNNVLLKDGFKVISTYTKNAPSKYG